jgi:hypothetical protein
VLPVSWGSAVRPSITGSKALKKGRRDYYSSFVGIERHVLFKCESWRNLSLRAKIVYLYLKAKYNGKNNGEIQLHFSELAALPGFNSRRAFYGSAKELEGAGWIERTNPGGLYRNPNLYKLTGRYDGML